MRIARFHIERMKFLCENSIRDDLSQSGVQPSSRDRM